MGNEAVRGSLAPELISRLSNLLYYKTKFYLSALQKETCIYWVRILVSSLQLCECARRVSRTGFVTEAESIQYGYAIVEERSGLPPPLFLYYHVTCIVIRDIHTHKTYKLYIHVQ